MEISGRKKLSELEIAGQFVLAMTKTVQKEWPSVARELNAAPFSPKEPFSDDAFAGYEFLLAVIACQIQSLPNLLAKEQSQRIRAYILVCLSSPEVGSYPGEALGEYQQAWNESLKREEAPFYGLASVLFDKLGRRETVQLGDGKFKDPLLLMALSEKIVMFGGPWWKNVIQEYRIVP